MTTNVLVIDDEASNLLLIEEFLSDEPYTLHCFERAEEGLAFLMEGASPVSVVLLDRMMPEMDGMQFIAAAKSQQDLKHIPIIMQTAAVSEAQVAEGLEAGVFYYLAKPFTRRVLVSLVRSALRDYARTQEQEDQRQLMTRALASHRSSLFHLRTLTDAEAIAHVLSHLYPAPMEAFTGLRELMVNAVEHGNLGISYEEKTVLNNEGRWEDEVARRLSLPEHRDKYATVTAERSADEIRVRIQDCGKGFDWQKYMVIDVQRALDNHGRGIAMAHALSFDGLLYEEPGNIVTCIKRVASGMPADPPRGPNA